MQKHALRVPFLAVFADEVQVATPALSFLAQPACRKEWFDLGLRRCQK